jgi:foldase protein PrsA
MATAGKGPDRISVDHILIGVKSSAFPEGKRTAAEARKVAYDLLAKIQAGADWATAKREHSEDPPPGGPYAMANRGVKPAGRNEYPRDGMVPAFGDVGFALEVGAIGMADHDPRTSPFGFHLIKRVS